MPLRRLDNAFWKKTASGDGACPLFRRTRSRLRQQAADGRFDQTDHAQHALQGGASLLSLLFIATKRSSPMKIRSPGRT